MLSLNEFTLIKSIECPIVKGVSGGIGIIPAILGAVTAIAPLATGLINKGGGGGSNEAAAIMAAQMANQQRLQEEARRRNFRNLSIGAGVFGLGLLVVALFVGRKRKK